MNDILHKIIKARKPKPGYKIMKEIMERWSPRHFSEEKIPLKDIKTFFEAARFAPSGRHHQPWYFNYAQKGSLSYQKLFSTLNKRNQLWAKTAPVLIIGCAIVKNKFGENPFAIYDLGASVISLILQAQSLGYYSRQMGLFDKEKVRKMFKINPNLEPFIIIALGKIGDYEKTPSEIIKMDLEPIPRKKNIFQKV